MQVGPTRLGVYVRRDSEVAEFQRVVTASHKLLHNTIQQCVPGFWRLLLGPVSRVAIVEAYTWGPLMCGHTTGRRVR